MLCQNCNQREANVQYTQITNGVKKEMHLCEECAGKLGITNINFSMPIDVSSFLGNFMEGYEQSLLPNFMNPNVLTCKECGTTYQDFVDIGKLGCRNCYDIFSNTLDSILKNIQGSNTHVGRIGRLSGTNTKIEKSKEPKIKKETTNVKKEENPIEQLKLDLKKAIGEERYEDAAKIRDEIKKLENKE